MSNRYFLGLDLALGRTGWAYLRWQGHGEPPQLFNVGSFATPSRRAGEPHADWLSRRAERIVEHLHNLIVPGKTQLVAYEVSDYVRAAWSGGSKGREHSASQGLGRAEGILIGHRNGCAMCSAVPLRAVTTVQAKEGFVGNGRASKAAILDRARLLCPGHAWTEDEADALAVCWVAAAELEREQLVAAAGGRE